jgi:dihydrodipicolinate synthase/N-acetylneuraminate lyase
MTLPIRQSELNAVGFTGYFPALDYRQRKEVAAMTLNTVGRRQDAFLLEINNVNAVRGITYIADTTPLRAGR